MNTVNDRSEDREDEDLELLDGDVEVKPSLRSRVWGDHEDVDDARHV